MKKISAIILVCLLIIVSMLSGCSSNKNILPKGRASDVSIMDSDSKSWFLGSGDFEYLNETTIKFVRDYDQETYYLSASTLRYIVCE